MNPCYCNSNLSYSDCCKPFLVKSKFPDAALELMRSRFTAYVLKNAKYLFETTHISQRKYTSEKQIMDWAKSNNFVKLEIINFSEQIVEFKAYFFNFDGKPQIHHEKSNFIKENGKWFYVDGEFY